MTTTKNEIKTYCTKHNLIIPKFSGKTRTAYYQRNINYNQQEQLKEFSNQLGYKYNFNVN